jgi:RNA polymerase sigma-70 factor (ECF subfamily)
MNAHFDADRMLTRRLLRGEERAFEELFDEYFPRLLRFARVRLGDDEQAAAEVVQAALCKAVDRLATYRGEAPLFTWLCTICRREIVDSHRARRRAGERLLEDGAAVRAALEGLAAAAADDPEQGLRRRELVRLVHAALDQLPARYGEALELRYLDGLSVAEIAARLKVGYKAAESVLSRARTAFRAGFEEVAVAVAADREAGA